VQVTIKKKKFNPKANDRNLRRNYRMGDKKRRHKWDKKKSKPTMNDCNKKESHAGGGDVN